jgi:hypothetical protein
MDLVFSLGGKNQKKQIISFDGFLPNNFGHSRLIN